MATVNLEKALIKQNKDLVIPEELLLISEFDKHAELIENDALSRVGLNKNLEIGKSIKNRIRERKNETKRFSQERVFHISQIEAVCKRYRLRFLPTRMYNGIIDKDLPNRIATFEIAYNIKCDGVNTKIVAPMESFELQEKPKDPLMFYQINDEYYYLIHKWGNDLSIFRALLTFWENGFFSFFFAPVILFFPFYFFPSNLSFAFFIGSFAIHPAYIFRRLDKDGDDQIYAGYLKPNQWDSPYK